MPSSDLESSYTPDKISSPPATAEVPVLGSYFPQATKQTTWSRVRSVLREPLAEMIGVATFVIIGTGVDCSVVLSTNPSVVSSPRGDFLSINFGWAIGLALGAWISGGISGGHLNPAVTLALATWRGFPWRKVPQYLLAQVLGGLIGSALVYANYVQAIDIFEGGHHIRTRATASLFATYALDYLNTGTAFAVELFGACILTFMVLAMTDKKNNAIPHGLLPIGLFLMLLGLGCSLGMQTSYAFNPARDFGPRLMLTFAGYGKQLYTYRSQYWLWAPILAPIIGAQVAAATYDIFLNEEDPFASSPSFISKKGESLRAPLAEFFGVAIFVLLGTGSNCQVALSSNPAVTASPKGEYLSLNFGWAIGLALAVWVSAGVSGGHVNPAITLVLATRRKFPWKKVPVYIFAQVMGGVIGAALSYAQYHRAIDIVEGGKRTLLTAGLFGAYPLDYVSAVSCFFSEFLGTAVLAFMIIAATDKKNAAPPLYLLPVVIFLTLLGLGVALGMQTSFAFNPARDFGPRVFLGMAGYGGHTVFSFRRQYWLWCPIIAPITGAQVAVLAYDLFLKDHTEDEATPSADTG
ncbi:hypothetical protein CVT24_003109 [Panaeolus cyanescens]|uniref:Aquaporin n=1 Tax=Panaeolus cyanescens TaxID=181874 RepID=A0A409YXV2_9AGAR|nr:hypothetical protein CVT24_003109 [Panaeolus cyanescens]